MLLLVRGCRRRLRGRAASSASSSADLAHRVLQVVVHRDDDVVAGGTDAAQERVVLAVVAVQADAAHALVLEREPAHDVPRAVAAAVFDEDHFEALDQCSHRRHQLPMQLRQVRLGVEHRDHDRDAHARDIAVTHDWRHQVEQVARVLGLAHRRGARGHGSARQPALLQRDLLQAGDLQRLPMLDGLHELAGLQQAFVRAGVEPGEAAAEQLARAAGRARDRARLTSVISSSPRAEGFSEARDVDDVVVVEVQAGDGPVRLRLLRLFLDARRRTPVASNSTTP